MWNWQKRWGFRRRLACAGCGRWRSRAISPAIEPYSMPRNWASRSWFSPWWASRARLKPSSPGSSTGSSAGHLVRECYAVSGEADFMLKCVGPNLHAMQDFIIKDLTAAANVDSVKTTLILRQEKYEPGIPIHERCRQNGRGRHLRQGLVRPDIIGALTAVVVGFASTILLIMEAADAVGANAAEKASWAAALCIGQAVTTLILSWRYRMPIITAWSTPGAALIATSSSAGIDYRSAIGAFIAAGLLMCVTALFKPVARAIEKIPASIAAGMLAGVLLRYSMGVPGAAIDLPWLGAAAHRHLLRLARLAAALRRAGRRGGRHRARRHGGSSVPGCCSLGITQPVWTTPCFNWPDHRRAWVAALSRHHGVAESSRFRGAEGFGLSAAGHRVTVGDGSRLDLLRSLRLASAQSRRDHRLDRHRARSASRSRQALARRLALSRPLHPCRPCRGKLRSHPRQPAQAADHGDRRPRSVRSAYSAAPPQMFKEKAEIEAALATFLVSASGITFYGVGAPFWGLVAGLILYGARHIQTKRQSNG